MITAQEAFQAARRYLTSDPIYADHSSVQQVLVFPLSNDRWFVICDYQRVNQQKERSAMFINNQAGQIEGFVKVQ